MIRFLLSLLGGLVVGLGIGLYLGWVQFPVEYVDSPFPALDPRFQEDYTVMVAAGYVYDRDLNAAFERLRLLAVENIPQYVQNLAESYITASRSIVDIRYLVALSEGFGRLTPLMEPYRMVNLPGQNP